MPLSRRSLLKAGLAAGAAGVAGVSQRASGKSRRDRDKDRDGDGDEASGIGFEPFSVDMPIPPVLEAVAGGLPGGPGAADHGIAPEFSPSHPDHDPDWNLAALKQYHIVIEQRFAEIIPGTGAVTPVFTYRDANNPAGTGTSPGPTILARFNEPIVVRQENRLLAAETHVQHDIELSTHLHGGHNPAHADGFPNFYILPGRDRDYFYPNAVPKRRIGDDLVFDPSTIPSTMWYHDHGMDLTGFTVSGGLAAFYLLIDDLEEGFMDDRVLPDVRLLRDAPDEACDIPIALTDQQFNADGGLIYDFLDHNGRIGRTFTVNGKAQPRFRVRRKKYRFRFLNASNARVYQLRLSPRRPFLVIGTDSWLLPRGVVVDSFPLAMSERQDVIIDFKGAPNEVFLENIMVQDDGRGPDEVDPSEERTPLIKFIVEGPDVANDVTVDETTELRPHEKIRTEDVVRTRVFEFERGNGAWQINERFFNPRLANAVPERDPDGIAAERWILKNDGGGWWHPIHMHLEHHEIQRINGRRPPLIRQSRSDVSSLAGTTSTRCSCASAPSRARSSSIATTSSTRTCA